jgi:hypothetical protein
VIIAKVGVTYFLSLNNQLLSGSDLTIECLDRALANLQEEYMANAPKLYIQGDNHTDVKTPDVLLWTAGLVNKGMFREARVDFMAPGNGHTVIDQKHSVVAREVVRRTSHPISFTRIIMCFRSGFKHEPEKPKTVFVKSVRDFYSAFTVVREKLGLGRLAVPNGSGEAQ